MLILRIEAEDGTGCYSENFSKSAHRAHDYGDCMLTITRHPCPYEDAKLKDRWNLIINSMDPHISSLHVRFAFATPEQYHHWFHTLRSREILREVGLRATFKDVPDQRVAVGDTQCVYDRRHAIERATTACDTPMDALLDAWLHLSS
jgi:hypothetical protein